MKRFAKAGRGAPLLVFLLALICCVPGQPRVNTTEGEALRKAGKYEEARVKYEEYRNTAPGRADIRFVLSAIYLNLARTALEKKNDEKGYAELIAKAQEEALAGLELQPENSAGHRLLGVVAAYRQDMDAARESFEIARQLDPINPLLYVDLGEVSVYRGKLSQARRYIEKGRRLGGPPELQALMELDEMLAAWRSGDYVEAQDLFQNLMNLNPDVVKKWNGAENIETFEQFTAKCCEDVTCGPFMKPACEKANQRVTERKLLQETLAQQIAMEQERKQRLGKVYTKLRELNIDVEEKEKDVNLDDVPENPQQDPRTQRPGPGGQPPQRRQPGQRRAP